MKATACCLRRNPRLNATLVDDEIHEFAEGGVSVALALPSDDLHVAVIKAADEKPLGRIAAELDGLKERASTGRLRPEDVRGGTFTISNYGMLRNVVWATPIISQGRSVCWAWREPRPGSCRTTPGQDGGIRHMLPLALTYDHRVVNGVPAGVFLDDLVSTVSRDDWLHEEDGR